MFTSVQSSSFMEFSPLDDSGDLARKLTVLRNSFIKIDEEIQNLVHLLPVNQLKLARLTQLKKNLKAQIEKLQSELYPNIVA